MPPESDHRRKAPLAEAIATYGAEPLIPFHTPGHKQGLGAHPRLRELITPKGLKEEVSLMDELDDLHSPQGVIKEAQDLIAELYGADKAFFMINGTTGAIHAMLLGVLNPGDTVLIPRNAHRSVIGGLILTGAKPVYLLPEIDSELGIAMAVSPRSVKDALAAHPEARAILLVYPTYYGVAPDLAAIISLARAKGLAILIDEAHGAHLPFSPKLPPEALSLGADLAAQSPHKLLGSLTQTSWLLWQRGQTNGEKIRRAVSLLQSTSPNYLLLASLDLARLQMAEAGEELVGRAVSLAEELREEINLIPGLYAFGEEKISAGEGSGCAALDVTKITVTVKELGLSGPEAADILRRKHNIQAELADAHNVLFIVSYADTPRQIAALLAALKNMAKHYAPSQQKPRKNTCPSLLPPLPENALSPGEAFFLPTRPLPLENAVGHIAAEEITVYPPGIPLISPGDKISLDTIAYLRQAQALGLKIVGPRDQTLTEILTIRNAKRLRRF